MNLLIFLRKELNMKRSKWTALTALLIATWTSTFATSNELFTNALPQTIDLSKSKPSDLYSRKDYNLPKEEGTTYLTGSLLFMAPQIPLFPNQEMASGSRLTGGAVSKIGGIEVSYTHLVSSFAFDSGYVFGGDIDKRLEIDMQFSLKDLESSLKIPYKLAFLGEGILFQGVYGIEYVKTERNTQYVYKKKPYSEKFSFSKLEGVGPLIGIQIERPISNTLSLVGKVSQSILRGKNRWWYSEKFTQYIPVTKTQLGLNWNIGDAHKQFFQLSTRYEAQYWFNEGFFDTGHSYKKQNLVLQGISLQGTLNF